MCADSGFPLPPASSPVIISSALSSGFTLFLNKQNWIIWPSGIEPLSCQWANLPESPAEGGGGGQESEAQKAIVAGGGKATRHLRIAGERIGAEGLARVSGGQLWHNFLWVRANKKQKPMPMKQFWCFYDLEE